MRNKLMLFVLLLLLSVQCVCADAENDAMTLYEQFPQMKYNRNYTDRKNGQKYYRFPSKVTFFEPIDLKYFPHETWNVSDWSLLSRREDSLTYNQMIVLDAPAQSIMAHGTAVGADYGFLSDFYLYATLFVTDNYPDSTGSCYVYFSNSLVKGFGESTGIFIDPQFGIYEVDNTYEAFYRLTNSSHEMTLLKEFSADAFPLSETDIASSSVGASDFASMHFDDRFVSARDEVLAASHMKGSTIRTYRVEVIRRGTLTEVYINGKPAVSFDDGILAESGDGFEPGKVSWSFGPVLYEGGQTVNCAVGDFYVWGPGK